MTAPNLAGTGLAIVAGLMAGNCMLPSKFLRFWAWENMWAAFSLLSLVVIPWALASIFVGHLAALYSSLPPSLFLAPLAFGFAWGIAQILFGISVARLGLSLAYAIIIGMGTALGTVVPMFATARSSIDRESLLFVFSGILLMIVGIVLTAWSGRLREQGTEAAGAPRRQSHYRISLILAVVCGFLAPMLNYSFAFGQGIASRAVALGHPPALAAYAVWPIGLAGGFLPNAAWSLWLLTRNRSWKTFASPFPDLFHSTAMAVLWMGAMAAYGMAAACLGPLGTSIGWGLFQIFMIMTASLSGLLTGEYRQASSRSRGFLFAGMMFLLSATVLLSAANRH